MPVKIKREYTRAKGRLNRWQQDRLNSIIDADPRMANHLNEHGLVHAAKSSYPIAVIPPEEYLRMARKHTPGLSESDSLDRIVDRIMSSPPNYGGDTYDLPSSILRFAEENPKATAYEFYESQGIGLPPGADPHPGIDVYADPYDPSVLDLGGLPALKYTPRGKDAISITDHEGRGRNAYATEMDFSLPIQMMERTAIMPSDPYIPFSGNNLRYMVDRLDLPLNENVIDERVYNFGETSDPLILNNDGEGMPLDKARGYLQQIKEVIGEDYIRHGGDMVIVPWKFPVFAKGGSVDADQPKNKLGSLSTIAQALRMAGSSPAMASSPFGSMLGQALPRIGEGVASEYYGVNQAGEVNLGGYTPGAPLRDRFRPNAAVEMLGLPALWGHEPSAEALEDVERVDTAVQDAFGHSEPEGFWDNAAYMTGKALAVPMLTAGRGINTLTAAIPKTAPKLLRYPIKAIETVTDIFNPASGRVRDTPIAGGIGAAIGEGLEAFAGSSADEEVMIDEWLNDPQKFMSALDAGDPLAMQLAQEYLESRNAH